MGFLLAVVLVPLRASALDPNRGIFQYKCRTWERHNGLPVSGVYAIAQTEDGYLWLGTSIGLLRFDGAGFSVVGIPPVSELRNNRITCLCPDRDGGLWFGIEKSSYGHRDPWGRWFVGISPHGDVDWDVHSLAKDTNGTLWVGGEYCSSIRAGTTNLQPLFAGQAQPPPVLAVLADSKGRVWLGTPNQGLYCWKDGAIHKIPSPLLDSRVINALAQDSQGRLWVGDTPGPALLRRRSEPRRHPTAGQFNLLPPRGPERRAVGRNSRRGHLPPQRRLHHLAAKSRRAGRR